MKKNMLAGAVVGFVVISGVSFYTGDAYGKSQALAQSNQNRAGMMGGARGGRGMMGGFTSGQIISVGTGSITIQMQTGSTQIILTSPTTQILKSASGSMSDLTMGTIVTATGSSNGDGSLTAQSIQIRPAGVPVRGATPVAPAGQ